MIKDFIFDNILDLTCLYCLSVFIELLFFYSYWLIFNEKSEWGYELDYEKSDHTCKIEIWVRGRP